MRRISVSLIYMIRNLMFMALIITSQSAMSADAQTFELGSWVCNSPEKYDEVTKAHAEGTSSAEALQKQHQTTCLYMDDDNIEDMLPPFVTLIETEGSKAKVAFFVEFYQKVEFLHRKIRHVRFVGWTASVNVKPFLN